MVSKLYKRKYLIRHKILKVLQDFQDRVYGEAREGENVYQTYIAMFPEDIAIKIDYPLEDVLPQLEVLHTKNLLSLAEDDNAEGPKYWISKSGSYYLYDDFFLDEGKKNLFTIVKETTTLITTIGLFLIAVVTFATNILETKKNSQDLKDQSLRLDLIDKKFKQKESEAPKATSKDDNPLLKAPKR